MRTTKCGGRIVYVNWRKKPSVRICCRRCPRTSQNCDRFITLGIRTIVRVTSTSSLTDSRCTGWSNVCCPAASRPTTRVTRRPASHSSRANLLTEKYSLRINTLPFLDRIALDRSGRQFLKEGTSTVNFRIFFFGNLAGHADVRGN